MRCPQIVGGVQIRRHSPESPAANVCWVCLSSARTSSLAPYVDSAPPLGPRKENDRLGRDTDDSITETLPALILSCPPVSDRGGSCTHRCRCRLSPSGCTPPWSSSLSWLCVAPVLRGATAAAPALGESRRLGSRLSYVVAIRGAKTMQTKCLR